MFADKFFEFLDKLEKKCKTFYDYCYDRHEYTGDAVFGLCCGDPDSEYKMCVTCRHFIEKENNHVQN